MLGRKVHKGKKLHDHLSSTKNGIRRFAVDVFKRVLEYRKNVKHYGSKNEKVAKHPGHTFCSKKK
jgi:hypothetical protein